jgi:hypothetical protein
MKPSRTYNIAIFGILAELVIAAVTLGIAIHSPESMAAAAEVLGLIAMSVGGASGAGAGAMAARDYGSGGVTSSQGELVLEHARGGE